MASLLAKRFGSNILAHPGHFNFGFRDKFSGRNVDCLFFLTAGGGEIFADKRGLGFGRALEQGSLLWAVFAEAERSVIMSQTHRILKKEVSMDGKLPYLSQIINYNKNEQDYKVVESEKS
jgi:hypothetical protein